METGVGGFQGLVLGAEGMEGRVGWCFACVVGGILDVDVDVDVDLDFVGVGDSEVARWLWIANFRREVELDFGVNFDFDLKRVGIGGSFDAG